MYIMQQNSLAFILSRFLHVCIPQCSSLAMNPNEEKLYDLNFDMHPRRRCSKMLWIPFSIRLQQNMKRDEQLGFVSNVKSNHARSLRR